jgi:TRAP-type C4-dicarboxylate transport system permease small subunit
MGLEEAMVYPALWLYMLGAVNASRENTQIRANVLDVFLETDRSKHILAAISDAISLIVGCWLTYWAWDYTEYSLRVWKESPTLYWPMFYADVSLVVGLILVNAFVIYHLIVQCRAIAWRAQSD